VLKVYYKLRKSGGKSKEFCLHFSPLKYRLRAIVWPFLFANRLQFVCIFRPFANGEKKGNRTIPAGLPTQY
jgi:hypothetical protein